MRLKINVLVSEKYDVKSPFMKLVHPIVASCPRQAPVPGNQPPKSNISWDFSRDSHENGVTLRNRPIIIRLSERKHPPNYLKVMSLNIKKKKKILFIQSSSVCYGFRTTKAPQMLNTFRGLSSPL